MANMKKAKKKTKESCIPGDGLSFSIKTFSWKKDMILTDISKPFPEAIEGDWVHARTFEGDIFFIEYDRAEECEGDLAAIGRYVFFNENAFLNNESKYALFYDGFPGDSANNPSIMISNLFDESSIDQTSWTCYISMHYVYPEFQNKGIEQYLYKNLKTLMQYCFDINVRCFVIYPRVLKPNGGDWDDWIEDLDNSETLKQIIVGIEEVGFKKCEEEKDFYVLTFDGN